MTKKNLLRFPLGWISTTKTQTGRRHFGLWGGGGDETHNAIFTRCRYTLFCLSVCLPVRGATGVSVLFISSGMQRRALRLNGNKHQRHKKKNNENLQRPVCANPREPFELELLAFTVLLLCFRFNWWQAPPWPSELARCGTLPLILLPNHRHRFVAV